MLRTLYFVSVCLIVLAVTLTPARGEASLLRSSESELTVRPLIRAAAVLEALRSLHFNYRLAVAKHDVHEAELDAEMLVKNLSHLGPLAPYDEIQEEVLSMLRTHFQRLERRGKSDRLDQSIFLALIQFISDKGTKKFSDIKTEIKLYDELDARGFTRKIRSSMVVALLKAERRPKEYGSLDARIEQLPPPEKERLLDEAQNLAAYLETNPRNQNQSCEVLLWRNLRSSRR